MYLLSSAFTPLYHMGEPQEKKMETRSADPICANTAQKLYGLCPKQHPGLRLGRIVGLSSAHNCATYLPTASSSTTVMAVSMFHLEKSMRSMRTKSVTSSKLNSPLGCFSMVITVVTITSVLEFQVVICYATAAERQRRAQLLWGSASAARDNKLQTKPAASKRLLPKLDKGSKPL